MSLEETLHEIARETKQKANLRIADQMMNRDRINFNKLLKRAHFNANPKVQGKTHLNTRHVADIPADVYYRMIELNGPDYWRDLETVKKYKQFHVVDRI